MAQSVSVPCRTIVIDSMNPSCTFSMHHEIDYLIFVCIDQISYFGLLWGGVFLVLVGGVHKRPKVDKFGLELCLQGPQIAQL